MGRINCAQCDKRKQAVEGLSGRIGVNPLCLICSSANHPDTIPNPDLKALNDNEKLQTFATKIHTTIIQATKHQIYKYGWCCLRGSDS